MLKLLYLVNQRIPTEKAYGIQISKMCEVFADAGLEVTLVAPRRGRGQIPDIFDYYSVKRNFKICYLDPPDFYWPGRLDLFAFWLKNIFSAWALARYSTRMQADVIYSRDELPLFFVSFLKPNRKLAFEAHKFSRRKRMFYNRFKTKGIKIMAISNGLAGEFLKQDFNSVNLSVAPDGVDAKTIEEEANKPLSKEEARRKLGLPLDSGVAVYIGGLYRWKGVYTLADAAKILPVVNFIVVGGGQGEAKFRDYLTKNRITNLRNTGYIKEKEVLRYYRSAADVLLLPNTAEEKLSEFYTSPLKLFEYMASQRPIVASDLPAVREILNENNAILVKPDNPQALAGGIKTALESERAETLSREAFKAVKNYTWQSRARNIVEFVSKWNF